LIVKSREADIFPTYAAIAAAKAKCRPPKEVFKITDNVAEVPLQSLLNHTAERIVQLQKDIIIGSMEYSKTTELEAILICSWGFDRSSGHSAYKQRYSDMSVSNTNDENFCYYAYTVTSINFVKHYVVE